jgi:hypothetical protein
MSTPAEPDRGPYRCSIASASRSEPMFATASRVDRWLLVEQPGPWGPETVPARRMDPAAFAAVSRMAREFRARLLLIRRPATADPEPGIAVFLAESRPGREWLMSRRVTDSAALAALEPPSRDTAWQDETDPLYLVCTHGRHDPCCALLGRPVAETLCAREPTRTWESSHVGGDRFGANVVVLPAGLYLGRVLPGRVGSLVEEIREGRIPLDRLRGRSGLSTTAQAAQHFARSSEAGRGQDRVGDLMPLSEQRLNDDTWQVVLQAASGPLAVTVRREPGDAAHRLTCHSVEPKVFPGFSMVSLDLLAAS